MNFQIVDPKPMDKNTLKGLFSLMAGPLKIEGFKFTMDTYYHWFPGKKKSEVDGLDDPAYISPAAKSATYTHLGVAKSG